MRRPACNPLFLLVVLFFSSLLIAQTAGSFRGIIVDGTHSAAGKTWIYVQSPNGMARRVDISHASVSYDASVPAASRGRSPENALTAGVEVRVIAEEGTNGEWRARRVEILKRQSEASQ